VLADATGGASLRRPTNLSPVPVGTAQVDQFLAAEWISLRAPIPALANAGFLRVVARIEKAAERKNKRGLEIKPRGGRTWVCRRLRRFRDDSEAAWGVRRAHLS
jgi:hypothetical protein